MGLESIIDLKLDERLSKLLMIGVGVFDKHLPEFYL